MKKGRFIFFIFTSMVLFEGLCPTKTISLCLVFEILTTDKDLSFCERGQKTDSIFFVSHEFPLWQKTVLFVSY